MQYFIKFNFTFCFFFHVASSDFKIRCVAHPILLWSGADPDHSGRVCLRQVRWEAELPVIVPALNALPTPWAGLNPGSLTNPMAASSGVSFSLLTCNDL